MSISKRRRWEILERDEFACRYCGRRAPGVVLEVDHVFPRSMGGPDTDDNLVAACADCNGSKGAREIKEPRSVFRVRRGYILIWLATMFKEEANNINAQHLNELADSPPIDLYDIVWRTQMWLDLVRDVPIAIRGSALDRILGLARLEREQEGAA